uniref:Putative LOC586954 [Strongylocentrotus purpuratus] n=1 Tax=Lepeophtheirus salmonis TaxID=72036 RepID=A0A0K2V916_LEPSM
MDGGNSKFCGRSHVFQKSKCPAFGKECSQCGKMGHFRVCCLSSAPLNDGVGDKAYAFLRVNGRRFKLLLDLGSNVNILRNIWLICQR